MTADQALSLQSLLLKLAGATGGTWAPALAPVGDVAISATSPAAEGSIRSRLSLGYTNGAAFLTLSRGIHFSQIQAAHAKPCASAAFHANAVEMLPDLDFDTIRDAFDRLRAEVHAAQVAGLAKIEAIRAAEAAANLH